MKPLFIFIHGINTLGERSTGALAQAMRDRYAVECRVFPYPKVSAFTAEAQLDQLSRELAEFIELHKSRDWSDVVLVGHSFGNLIIHHMLTTQLIGDRTVKQLHMIAPAMQMSTDWARVAHRFTWANAYCNPLDIATAVAALSRVIVRKMGAAGNLGFWDHTIDNHLRWSTRGPFNHSANWFQGQGLTYLCQHLAFSNDLELSTPGGGA